MTEQTAQPAAPETVLKLTLKTMGCEGAIVKVTKEKTALARIIGVARNIKTANGQNGDPVFGLTGTFEGVNLIDGKNFQSAVCYLPSGLIEMIMDPLEVILNGDDKAAKAQGVTFAMDVFALPDGNKAGYTFSADMLNKPVQADPLAALKETLAGKALPARSKALPKAN